MSELFLIVGNSGVGKTSIMKEVMDNKVVTYTTRTKRQGEVDGIDYHFITVDEFHQLDKEGKLLETTYFSGNFYGVSQDCIKEALDKGDAYCILTMAGVKKVGVFFYNTVILLTSDRGDLAIRLNARNSEDSTFDERIIDNHSSTFVNEVDYVVKNKQGNQGNTINILREIVLVEGYG